MRSAMRAPREGEWEEASAAAEQKAKKENKRGNWGVLQAVIWKWFLNTNTRPGERKKLMAAVDVVASAPIFFC